MPFEFDCATCGAELKLREAPQSGTQLRCPQCGGAFRERVAAPAAQPPPKFSITANPYVAPLESSEPPREELDDARVRELAERLVKEKHDRTVSRQLLATGLIGCFSPLLAIYGAIFLILRPRPFPGKRLAVAGTVLHWIWAFVWVYWIFLSVAGR